MMRLSRKGMLGLFLVLVALSGCRFGNHTEYQNDGTPSLEGLYGTEAQTLTFCAGLASGTVCKDAATNLIPPLVSATMTNPIYLNLGTSNVGLGEFVNPY